MITSASEPGVSLEVSVMKVVEVFAMVLEDPNLALRCVRASALLRLGHGKLPDKILSVRMFNDEHLDWIADAVADLSSPARVAVKINEHGFFLTKFLFVPRTVLNERFNGEDRKRIAAALPEQFRTAYDAHSSVFKRRRITYTDFAFTDELRERLAPAPLLHTFLAFLKFELFRCDTELFYHSLVVVAAHLENARGREPSHLRGWMESHFFFWELRSEHVEGFVRQNEPRTWRQYPPFFEACHSQLRALHRVTLTFKGQRVDAVRAFAARKRQAVEVAVALTRGRPATPSVDCFDGLWTIESLPHHPIRRKVVEAGAWGLKDGEHARELLPFVKPFPANPKESRDPALEGAYEAVAAFIRVRHALRDRPESRDVAWTRWQHVHDEAREGGRDEAAAVERDRAHLSYSVAAVRRAAAEVVPDEALCRGVTHAYRHALAAATSAPFFIQKSFRKKPTARDLRLVGTSVRECDRRDFKDWYDAAGEVWVLVLAEGGAFTSLDCAYTSFVALREVCKGPSRFIRFVRCWQETRVFVTDSFATALAACGELVQNRCKKKCARAYNYLRDFEDDAFADFLKNCRAARGCSSVETTGEELYDCAAGPAAEPSNMVFFKHPCGKLLHPGHPSPIACALSDLLELLTEAVAKCS